VPSIHGHPYNIRGRAIGNPNAHTRLHSHEPRYSKDTFKSTAATGDLSCLHERGVP
jgi:hypothetical protein